MTARASHLDLTFASLPAPPRKRWKYIGYGFLSQFILLMILIQIGLIQPQVIIPKKSALVLTMTYPVPVPQHTQKVPPALLRIPKPKPVIEEPPKLVAKIPPAPVIEAPKIAPPKPVVTKVFESMPVAKIEPKPGPIVKTGSFNSGGSSATPTTTLRASQVQTGGFGDPNGIAAKNTSNGPSNISKVGSFELPQGEGSGNGTGGAKGARGVVISAGFGNGEAASGGGGHGRGGVVKTVGFSDEAAPAPAAPRTRAAVQPETTSAEVLSKPTPQYTAEARALKLEGEVLLEVVFTASGKIQVVRVVRGLGHGLDENAIRAAEQIRFKPATRAGSPVDSTATLHIVFQLA